MRGSSPRMTTPHPPRAAGHLLPEGRRLSLPRWLCTRDVTGSKQQYAKSLIFWESAITAAVRTGGPTARGTDFGLRKHRRGHMTKLKKNRSHLARRPAGQCPEMDRSQSPESEDADKLRAVELILHLMDDVPALLDKLSETETLDESLEAETSEEQSSVGLRKTVLVSRGIYLILRTPAPDGCACGRTKNRSQAR
jgi:hypothetical protein